MCAIEYMKISRRFFKIENKPQNTLLIEINIFQLLPVQWLKGDARQIRGPCHAVGPAVGG